MNRNEKYPEYEMLHRFALDCAAHKINNDCNQVCRNCPSNISLYITTGNLLRPAGSDGLSAREAVMLQHTAELEMKDRYARVMRQRAIELEYKRQEQQSNAEYANRARKVLLVMLVMFVVPIALVWKCTNDNNKRYAVSTALAPPIPAPAPVPVVKYDKNGWRYDETKNKWVPGPNAVYKQQTAPVNPVKAAPVPADLNGDGQITCIDHALRYYETHDNVRIMYSASTTRPGNAHLFVRVNGVDIEPSNGKRLDEHWAGIDNWPNRRDMTSDYAAIRNGTKWGR
jgi:hypothetical protein